MVGDFTKAEALGELVRELREKRHPKMTQAQLGRAIGLSRPSISLLERGQILYPRIHLLEQLAVALDAPVSRFYMAMGATLPEAEASEVHWVARQLDQRHLRLLIRIAHELLQAQHDLEQTGEQPSARRARRSS